MLVTIVGIEIKSGSFTPEGQTQAKAYNNIMIYGLKDNTYQEENNMGMGYTPISLKIKNRPDVVSRVFGFVPTVNHLNDMLDQVFEFYYNEKGMIDKIVSPTADIIPAENKKGA